MAGDYVYFSSTPPSPGGCYLEKMSKNVTCREQLMRGIPIAESFPGRATLQMRGRPNERLLTDFARNPFSLLIVSERVRRFMLDRRIDHLEILPITILSPTRAKKKERYFIIHPVGLVDAIDSSRSVGVPSPLRPGEFMAMEKLVLKEASIAPSRQLFRLKRYPQRIFFSRDLAEGIEREGFSGANFKEVSALTPVG